MTIPVSKRLICFLLLFAISFACLSSPAQSSGKNDDDNLIDSFISAKGYQLSITFDTSNIKQYWINKSVAVNKGAFQVLLNREDGGFFSDYLKIQLMNVSETLNCRVEVITEQSDVDFTVNDSQKKTISNSTSEDPFLQYHVLSAVFPMENTPDYSFYFRFQSKRHDVISIKKIVLSFSPNPNSRFLVSPGTFSLDIKKALIYHAAVQEDGTVTGKKTCIHSDKYIMPSNKDIVSSVKIKNAGKTPTQIHLGYYLYMNEKGLVPLYGYNLPYSRNDVLTVISAEAGKNSITVDSFPKWEKNCRIAINAKKDLSDLPNVNLVDGKIVEVKQLENGQAAIILDKPLKKGIEPKTTVRITGKDQGQSITINTKLLQPGEEVVVSKTVTIDDSTLNFTSNNLPKQVYCILPFLYSYSVDPNVENSIQIREFSISF